MWVTVLGSIALVIVVPSSLSTPWALPGRVATRTSLSGSPSLSVILKSDLAKVRSTLIPVALVKSFPLGTALVPRTLTGTPALCVRTVRSASAVSTASLPLSGLLMVAPGLPDSRTRLPPASRLTVMPLVSLSPANTVYGPKYKPSSQAALVVLS